MQLKLIMDAAFIFLALCYVDNFYILYIPFLLRLCAFLELVSCQFSVVE